MNTWTEKFKSHNIWKNLETLGPCIDQASVRPEVEPASSESLARLKVVLSFVGERLATADPALVDFSIFDAIAITIQAASTEVELFLSSGSPECLSKANSHADVALTRLAGINIPSSPGELNALRDAAIHYREGMEEALRATKSTANQALTDLGELTNRSNNLSTELTAEKQRLSSIVSEQQGQFSASQETRSKEYSVTQASQQDRFTALLADYIQKLADQSTQFNIQKESIARQHEVEIQNLKTEFVGRAKNLQTEIEVHLKQVEKLVGVIGNLGVTAGYQRAANVAQLTTRVWQAITVVAMVALICIAYCSFLPNIASVFSWSAFATRTLILASIASLAGYSAQQASKYQESEQRNRRLALELEAIGPFMAPLPEDKQQEFRLKIGDRTFGQNDPVPVPKDHSSTNAIELFLRSDEFQKIMTAVVTAVKK